MTSRQDIDSSAHLDKQSRQHHVSWIDRFDLHSIKSFTVVFQNNTATCFAYTTMALGQPTGLSKELCLYVVADWLRSSVCQKVASSQLLVCLSGKFFLVSGAVLLSSLSDGLKVLEVVLLACLTFAFFGVVVVEAAGTQGVGVGLGRGGRQYYLQLIRPPASNGCRKTLIWRHFSSHCSGVYGCHYDYLDCKLGRESESERESERERERDPYLPPSV